MTIKAEAAWSSDDGPAVFICTDGTPTINGYEFQLEPMTVLESLVLCEQILKAAKQAELFAKTEGES